LSAPSAPIPPARPAPDLAGLAADLRDEARRLGFDPVGIAAVPGGPTLSLRTAALERWLATDHQAGMD
jgi:epoxyqueuosine reductase